MCNVSRMLRWINDGDVLRRLSSNKDAGYFEWRIRHPSQRQTRQVCAILIVLIYPASIRIGNNLIKPKLHNGITAAVENLKGV